MPPDPAATIRALKACRAAMVMAAIDGFATVLTGQRHYFHADGSTMSEARRKELEERDARERGEKQWES